jgi:riboflavin kinase/FMN adenylyltransferase
MIVIRDESGLPQPAIAVAATIGVFDGFHKGHRFITESMLAEAKKRGVASLLITFDVHPKKVHAHPFSGYITHRETKLDILRELGVDYVWYVSFDDVRGMSPEAFVAFVKKHFDLKAVVVGEDFKFGKGAQAGVATLRTLGEKNGFVVVAPARVDADGGELSSTVIRDLIRKGDLDGVKAAMGRSFSVIADVVRGIGAGQRDFHVPTANIDVADRVVPPCGIYAATVVFEEAEYPAVAYLGTAPSMRDAGKPDKLILESYIFDKTFDLYGKRIEVRFHRFIRPEQIFTDQAALSAAIHNDIAEAKKYFGIPA